MRRLPAATLVLLAACHAAVPDDDDGTDPPETDAEVPSDSDDTEVPAHTDEVPSHTDETDALPCGIPDPAPAGGCTFALATAPAGDPLVFTTSGCWTVEVDHTTITITDSRGTATRTVESWGTLHENLNGKHVKDWQLDRRTILVPGGVVVTMHAADGVAATVSLYDGVAARTIDTASNTITASTDDAGESAASEAGEADGEAARITELTCEAIAYDNVYVQAEDDDGAPLAKEPAPAQIGVTGGTPNPNQVTDFWP